MVMEIISIFFPTILSFHIHVKRAGISKVELWYFIRVYGLYALVQNFITWIIVDYGLGIVVNEDAFTSMQFDIKYLSIAVIVSFCLPYIWELISKYISVHVEIEEKTSEQN